MANTTLNQTRQKSKAPKVQFISVQSLSWGWLFVTPWTAALKASLSVTNSQSLLKLMSIKSVIPSNHLILCHPLLLLPSVFPTIRVFSNESALCKDIVELLFGPAPNIINKKSKTHRKEGFYSRLPRQVMTEIYLTLTAVQYSFHCIIINLKRE